MSHFLMKVLDHVHVVSLVLLMLDRSSPLNASPPSNPRFLEDRQSCNFSRCGRTDKVLPTQLFRWDPRNSCLHGSYRLQGAVFR